MGIDWTAVSVVVAVAVFVAEMIDRRRSRQASSRLIAEYLALDLSNLVIQSRQIGMYVGTMDVVWNVPPSRADRFLIETAEALALPTIERHAESLANLPPALTHAVALCVVHLRELKEETRLFTSDEVLGRNYLSLTEGKRRTNQAAATLMQSAEKALAIADQVRAR